jgi:hypothetical protein
MAPAAFIEGPSQMRRHLVITLGVLVCLVAPPAIAQDTIFPTVKARTLNKDKITVPKDFSAARNVLLISFGRDMQEPVDAWDAALTPLRESSDAVQVYNSPLIPNPGALVRGFINGGFRGIYKDKTLRERVVILYIDEDEVFPALSITDEDKAVPLVLVTDQVGGILGRVSGLANEANVAAVTALATP